MKADHKVTDITIMQMLDITSPKDVEVIITPAHDKLWINVDGICRFRACRIKHLTMPTTAVGNPTTATAV